MEPDDRGIGPGRAVRHHQAGDVDREQPAAVHDRGQAVDQGGARHDEERVQPAGHRDAVQHRDEREAADQAEGGPDGALPPELEREAPARHLGAGQDELGQHDHQEDRDRVVGAGFDLERGVDPGMQAKPAGPQQEEHRRRVRGRDDRAEQQRLDRLEVEHRPGRRAGDRGGDEHADGGEQQRGREHAAEDREPCPQAAVEEDHRERHRAHEVGGAVVVEDDPARPVLAREHADDQEDEQQRRAEAGGDQAGEDAEDDERRADEDQGVDDIETCHLRRRLPAQFARGFSRLDSIFRP